MSCMRIEVGCHIDRDDDLQYGDTCPEEEWCARYIHIDDKY